MHGWVTFKTNDFYATLVLVILIKEGIIYIYKKSWFFWWGVEYGVCGDRR